MARRHRMVRIWDRKVPLIEKELSEVNREEVTGLLVKHGAVMIRDPRWEATVKSFEKRKRR
jgi:hypothetical protein